jgi:hypothetical protein
VDQRRLSAALVLLLIGAVGRLLLTTYLHVPNLETIMVASLLAGSLLGGRYAVLVPLGAVALSDAVLYATVYRGYDPSTGLGVSLFTGSGFAMAALLGRAVKPRMVLALRGVALVTTISIPATIAYDLWTAFGEWLFLSRPLGWSLERVLQFQVPFTILHLISSLLLVPLVGSGFLLWWSRPTRHAAPSPKPTDEGP